MLVVVVDDLFLYGNICDCTYIIVVAHTQRVSSVIMQQEYSHGPCTYIIDSGNMESNPTHRI